MKDIYLDRLRVLGPEYKDRHAKARELAARQVDRVEREFFGHIWDAKIAGAGVSEIAAACGMSRPTVYRLIAERKGIR